MKTTKYLSVIATFFVCCSALQAQEHDSDAKTVTILAVNDMHAAMDLFPQFAGIVDSLRGIYPNLLLFSAGDNRTGNPSNDRYPETSWPMADLMNRVGFDASAVGNHEFDSGQDGFRNIINKSNFLYLCANINAPDSLRLHTAPYRFFERNGVRIGVLGLVQTGENGLPDAHPSLLSNMSFDKPADVVKNFRWMREQCDVLILLTHCGYEDDLALADTFPEADIIIGGHTHTVVPNRVLRNGVIVTQTGRALKYVTELDLEVSGKRVTAKDFKLLDVKTTTQHNAAIQTVVDNYNNNETLNQVLSTVAEPFENYEELGCLMVDAQRDATNGDIAIMNAGSVRYETHAVGNFTVKDAYALDPFNNEIYAYIMTGQEVQQLIQSTWDIKEDAYVSGVTYNVTKDAGGAVKKISVFLPNGKPIEPAKKYRVVMGSYIATVCPFTKDKEYENTFVGCTDALIEYLKKQPSLNYKGVKRIKIN